MDLVIYLLSFTTLFFLVYLLLFATLLLNSCFLFNLFLVIGSRSLFLTSNFSVFCLLAALWINFK